MFEFLLPRKKPEAIKPLGPVAGKIKPVVLLVLDGFGIAPPSSGNAISQAKTPNLARIYQEFPHSQLIASGESVGLPANEVGNTEVGHLTLGAGRVILQDLKRINSTIEDQSLFVNQELVKVADHVKKHDSKLHLFGLIGSGHVHSSVEHLKALTTFCRRHGLKKVCLHLFTDGRDSPPNEGITILANIQNDIKDTESIQIASIAGRYYAMDRDRRWSRTQLAYDAITQGIGPQSELPGAALTNYYNNNLTDEFIPPTVITRNQRPIGTVDDNDAVIFFNFRVDRAIQLTSAFTIPDFEKLDLTNLFKPAEEVSQVEQQKTAGNTFKRAKIASNVHFTTMTRYHRDLPVAGVLFDNEKISGGLSETLSLRGLNQLHMSESEKERFVTYYFSGLKEQPFKGEDKIIVPSPKVATYDKKPEMSAFEVLEKFRDSLNESKYNFHIINVANPDMVAHSGNIKATIKAIEFTDSIVGGYLNLVLAYDGILIITADHGNAEELLTYPSHSFFFTSAEGKISTDHSNNPVPFILAGNKFRGKTQNLKNGALCDVAPTILSLMIIEKPKEMTGTSLLV